MQYVVALRLVFARATDAYLVIIVNCSISTTRQLIAARRITLP